MSFTSDVKTEISLETLGREETRAQLSALVLMLSSISISSDGTALVIRTSSAPVSRAIYRMMNDLYDVQIETFVQRRMNLKKNLIYGFRFYGNVTGILKDLGLYSSRGLLEKPLQKIVSKDACARAYLAGAFMADGSVNSPETSGYHLEIRASSEAQAGFLVDLRWDELLGRGIPGQNHMPRGQVRSLWRPEQGWMIPRHSGLGAGKVSKACF